MIDNEARWKDNFDKIIASFRFENKVSFETSVVDKTIVTIVYLLSNSC